MKLEFAFLADAATITEDGCFSVEGGGFDVLQTQGFPAIKPEMALVGRVVFEVGELEKTFLLHGEIVGPGGSPIPPEMWLVIKPFPHPRDPNRANWTTICLNYRGVPFPTPGEYVFRLSIGSEVLGQVTLEVLPPKGQT